MNSWIEKVVREIGHSAVGDKEHWKQIILKYAPVIDAQKIARGLRGLLLNKFEEHHWVEFDKSSAMSLIDSSFTQDAIAQQLAESMDMDIKWEDGRAEFGQFLLRAYKIDQGRGYTADIVFEQKRPLLWHCVADTQELAQAACELALKRIITGCGSVGKS